LTLLWDVTQCEFFRGDIASYNRRSESLPTLFSEPQMSHVNTTNNRAVCRQLPRHSKSTHHLIDHCWSSSLEISCFWCEGANLGYVEAITAADIAEGERKSARGSHAERRFAWRSFYYPLAAVAQAWPSTTSRNAPSTTPRGNAPPSALETMIHVQKYRLGWVQQCAKQPSWLQLIWTGLKRHHTRIPTFKFSRERRLPRCDAAPGVLKQRYARNVGNRLSGAVLKTKRQACLQNTEALRS
jgi:hypothetical protein